jgi:hypothetical protein
LEESRLEPIREQEPHSSFAQQEQASKTATHDEIVALNVFAKG